MSKEALIVLRNWQLCAMNICNIEEVWAVDVVIIACKVSTEDCDIILCC